MAIFTSDEIAFLKFCALVLGVIYSPLMITWLYERIKS